jgi:hypothetical protein
MTKLTSIEGGGGGRKDHHDGWSRHFLHSLIIELLRALARGDDLEGRVVRDLQELINHASATSTPLAEIVDDVIPGLHKDIFPEAMRSRQYGSSEAILQSCLRVVAEACCHDGAARGRRSRRERALESSIEQYIVENEKRSRANNWSYLGRLIDHHLPPPPYAPQGPKKPDRRQKPPIAPKE